MKKNESKIDRRDFMRRMLTLAGASALSGVFKEKGFGQNVQEKSEIKDEKMKKLPNIVWLIADDAGLNTVHCMGNEGIQTPNLDRLCSEGTYFTSAFVTAPSCSPCRSTMFTGQFAHTIGTHELHSPIPKGVKMLPEYLREKGYKSGLFGKNHMGKYAESCFDIYDAKLPAWEEFLESAPADKPFFMTLAFYDPHRPFRKGGIEHPHDPAKVFIPPYLLDCPPLREEMAQYYDGIGRNDAVIGKLLKKLEDKGIYDNTIIIYVGDNGMPFAGAKTTLYDSGIGTPFIVKWTGVAKPAAKCDGLVSVIDMSPTVLEAAGIEKPKEMLGTSFMKMLKNPDERINKYIFAERNWHCIDDHIRAVRTEQFKYIRNYYPEERAAYPVDLTRDEGFQTMRKMRDEGKLTPEQMQRVFAKSRPKEELYDIKADPWEFKNLAGDPKYADILKELSNVLDKWIIETKDVPPTQRLKDTQDPETGKTINEYGPRDK